jgi:hypothetical protein
MHRTPSAGIFTVTKMHHNRKTYSDIMRLIYLVCWYSMVYYDIISYHSFIEVLFKFKFKLKVQSQAQAQSSSSS